jgi:hypothetical protein
MVSATLGHVPKRDDSLLLANEKHLRNLKQLTFGGENAEAYFSADGKQLIFQSTRDGRGCDQIYTMNVDGSNVKMISNGDGRTTCSYFILAESEFFTHQHISATSSARRSRTFLVVTSGLFIRASIFSLPNLTAAISNRSRTRLVTTLKRRSRSTVRRLSSRRCATVTSTSTRWTQTARTYDG